MPGEIEEGGRRRSKRAQAVLLMARLSGTTFDTICMVQDISPFGAKIRTALKLSEDDLVSLDIAGCFKISATVCWTGKGFVGLSFRNQLDEGSLFDAVVNARGRRMAQRFRRCADVSMATARQVLSGRLSNLSTGGAAIELDGGRSPGPRTPVTLTIKRFLQRPGHVQWTTESHVGIAFESPLRLEKMEHCLIGWLKNCQACSAADCTAPSFQLSQTKREQGQTPVDPFPELQDARASLPSHLAAYFAIGSSKSHAR